MKFSADRPPVLPAAQREQISTVTPESGMPGLLEASPAGGCGCKLDPSRLDAVLEAIGLSKGAVTGGLDDAAVFEHDGQGSLLFTVDFFTPLVDDPADWGRIAAAHAMSDIYAMGGQPLLALSVAAWSKDDLPLHGLTEALAAAREKLAEGGAQLAGGHTIWDDSPKLGFAVVGRADQDSILRKAGGKPGDLLFLTKPLGSGLVCTALKRREASLSTVRRAIEVMVALNADARAAAASLQLRCATDVTGFGLAGHLREIADASGVSAVLRLETLPVIPGALDLVPRHLTGNAPSNRQRADPRISPRIDPRDRRLDVLFDPQTSGGLLIACPPHKAPELELRLCSAGATAARIGRLEANAGVAAEIVVEP